MKVETKIDLFIAVSIYVLSLQIYSKNSYCFCSKHGGGEIKATFLALHTFTAS